MKNKFLIPFISINVFLLSIYSGSAQTLFESDTFDLGFFKDFFELSSIPYGAFVLIIFTVFAIIAIFMLMIWIFLLKQQIEQSGADIQKELYRRRYIEDKLKEYEIRYNRILDESTNGIVIAHEIERLNNLLDSILNSMPFILIGIDDKFSVIHWNNGAQKISGISPIMAKGKRIDEIFPLLKTNMNMIKKAMEKESLQKETKVLKVIDTREYYYNIMAYPLIINNYKGAFIILDDITERVNIEEMMIQSEKMLSLGGLAAGMAHEINNPLAGIMQNIQVMENRLSVKLEKNMRIAEECNTDIKAIEAYIQKREINKMIDTIMASGKRAAHIVNNMLSFTRKSFSKFLIHDICDLMDKTLELASNDYELNKEYHFRKIEVIKEYETHLPEISCEGSKIQQVFFNILKNSVYAMKDNKNSLKRLILRIKGDNNFIRIEVEDNGKGMEAETQKHIFEPFYSTRNVGSGIGLGLSVSYFIITENHKGEMSVTSSPQNGTIFTVKLPFKSKQIELEKSDLKTNT